jgi:thymidylate kinase
VASGQNSHYNKKMLISFSGVQSSGKTTLLKACKEIYGDQYEFVDEVTRLVKREFNVPINEQGTGLTQCLIVNKHIENALRPRENKGAILDRCILDGYCYTGYLTLEGTVPNWVFDYTKHVFERLVTLYDVIFYTDPTDVILEDDGERSNSIEFRNKMIEIFEFVIDQHKDDVLKNKLVRLKGTVEERMEAIKIKLH